MKMGPRNSRLGADAGTPAGALRFPATTPRPATKTPNGSGPAAQARPRGRRAMAATRGGLAKIGAWGVVQTGAAPPPGHTTSECQVSAAVSLGTTAFPSC